MDPIYRQLPRRISSRPASRRRPALVFRNTLLALLLLALLVAIVPFSRWFYAKAVSQNDFFTLRHADVITDGVLSADHILRAAGVAVGANLFAFSLDDLRNRIAADPLVQSVTVVRRLPDTLLVSVSERRPVARITAAGVAASLAIDASGHVLGPSALRSSLPILSGLSDTALAPGDTVSDPLLPPLLDLVALCNRPEIRNAFTPKSFDVSDRSRILMTLETGETALLSLGDFDEKLRRLMVIRRVAAERSLPLCHWDLTADRSCSATP